MRGMVIEFLEADVFSVSAEYSLTFLDLLIESWDIDLVSFGMEIVLNRRLAPGHPKKFEFVEQEPVGRVEQERGFKEFLHDPMLRGDATVEEIAVLDRMTFTGKRPTALYYYRELQNLRDPLTFSPRRPRPSPRAGHRLVQFHQGPRDDGMALADSARDRPRDLGIPASAPSR